MIHRRSIHVRRRQCAFRETHKTGAPVFLVRKNQFLLLRRRVIIFHLVYRGEGPLHLHYCCARGAHSVIATMENYYGSLCRGSKGHFLVGTRPAQCICFSPRGAAVWRGRLDGNQLRCWQKPAPRDRPRRLQHQYNRVHIYLIIFAWLQLCLRLKYTRGWSCIVYCLIHISTLFLVLVTFPKLFLFLGLFSIE